MKVLYEADAINKMIPQKYPFCLVDRILSHKPGQEIICLKNVTQNEEFFLGHFPDRKIMPGVLVCEALAQTCVLLGLLDLKAKSKNDTTSKPADIGIMEPGFLASINMKFMKPVLPGDQLLLKSISAKKFSGLKAFEVEAAVGREIACKGILKTTLRKG
jgi:3-hydroxyacyl-[acyl-carrier-protein] dehydratase